MGDVNEKVQSNKKIDHYETRTSLGYLKNTNEIVNTGRLDKYCLINFDTS